MTVILDADENADDRYLDEGNADEYGGAADFGLPDEGEGSNAVRRVPGNQSEIQILAAASRDWARYISNADPSPDPHPDSLDPAFWDKFHRFLQTMKDFASFHSRLPLPAHRPISYTRFLTFHIRIRGDLGDEDRNIIDQRTPKFQNIWGPEACNADVVEPFAALVSAKKPVFLVAAGSTGAGKTHTFCRPAGGQTSRLTSRQTEGG